MHKGFIYLDQALPGVRQDAKYATRDNFTGDVVEGYWALRVVGSIELADGLAAVRRLAAGQGYDLLLWDGYRPQRAVDCFARWAAAPEDGRTKAAHYPNIDKRELFALGYIARRSGHSRGGAIDLTLVDAQSGRPLDMGGPFDLMDKRSHHGAAVSPIATRNRAALRALMERCGFAAYENEWWHYALIRQPYPGAYFDFPIE
ncbi:MAG: M15 family metallopeptidase [Clostridiales bacterium]|nr:M15 family metallopeptidase [Clostridiales bacterium]